MPRIGKELVLEVSASRCVLLRGGAGGLEELRRAGGAAERAWTDVVEWVLEQLTQWATELSLEGAPVHVVYQGPETAVGAFECPATLGESQANAAARLALEDTLSYSDQQRCISTAVLSNDEDCGEARPARRRTVVVADCDASLASLFEAVQNAGLTVRSMIPAPAVSLLAASDVVQRSAGDGLTVSMWIGAESTGLVAGDRHGLVFARMIPVGVESLVEALAGLRGDGGDAIGRRVARDSLFHNGIPSHEGGAESDPQFDARAVLPLLQPVLQRLIVETKQSVRFGLPTEAKDQATLRVSGPGSLISGLARLIGDGTGIAIEQAPPAEGSAAARGDAPAVYECGVETLGLLPRSTEAHRSTRRTRRALALGAALAGAVLTVEGVAAWMQLKHTSRTLDMYSSIQVAPGVNARDMRDRAVAVTNAVEMARTRQRAFIGSTVPHADLLFVLAEATPPGMELTEVVYAESETGPHLMVRGMAKEVDGVAAADRVRSFTRMLGDCPLIVETHLGETRRTEGETEAFLSFIVTLDLLALPRASVYAESTADPEAQR